MRSGQAPVLRDDVPAGSDALHRSAPQALVLTAIVIAFAMTAVSLVLAIRSRSDNGSDHVDAHEDATTGVDTREARR